MGRFLDGLIAWSIRNRYVVLLGAAALVVVGVVAFSRASFDVLPDFMPSRVVIQTEAPGMSTLDVEELVTRPVERAVLGTPQVASVRSASQPGLSVVTLLFEDDVDVYRARQLVTERLQIAALPAGAHVPRLAPIAAPIGALLKICLTSDDPDQKRAARDLRAFADWTIKPRLQSIPGVSGVVALGGAVERIEIRPDPVRLRERGVTIAELVAAVGGTQAITGAGFVETGASRVDVQSGARLTIAGSIDAIRASVIGAPHGTPVRVGDVADVVHGEEPAVGAALYDGKPAVYLQIGKLPVADTLDVTTRVERALAELVPNLPAGARLEAPIFRQADFVRTSIWSVGRAMAIGSILVIVVLVVFLRHGRLAVISLSAIPLSLLAAVAVLVASGASINGMTLGGLAIAVGEVVDDAIVDLENVWRRLRENARSDTPRPPLDVIHDASIEIRSSVVYATIIVGLVLVPVLLLGGIAGRIFAPLAHAYMLAIAASLLVALTVTPALCAVLLPRLATREAQPSRLARSLTERYRRAIGRIVNRPRLVVGTAVLAAVAAMIAVPFLSGRFLPEFHERTMIAHVLAVPGTSLDEAARIAGLVDRQARPEVAVHVAARAGRAELDEDAAPVHRIEIDFVISGEGGEWDEVVIDLARHIGAVPGVGFVVEGFLGERIHEILAGDTAPVVVKVIGPDLDVLRRLAAEAAGAMARTPGLGSPRIEPQIDVPQLRIIPDPAGMARFGVRADELFDQVLAWRQGRQATQVLDPSGRIMDVVIAGPVPMRDLAALPQIPIETRRGTRVPLSALAQVVVTPAAATISRDDGERRISIGASASSGLSGAVDDLRDRLSSIELPRGYRLEVQGEAVARKQAARRLLLVGALVLLGIVALLATAFGSMRDAGLVLLNFPLGLIGGVVGALLTPEGLSVAGFIGFVTLFGIISRNGIMLVAHKRHLDATHPDEEPVARVLRAAEERLLPILMTAITAGLALLPLALSFEAAGSELEAPMAMIVCGGLVTSTALNMIVLPTIYVWIARRRARRAAREEAPS